MPFSLQVSTSEAIAAQRSAPLSEPAKRAFFLVSAIGRIERSTVLESISILPSSMKRVRPSQRARGVADGVGEFALLADGLEPGAEPRLHGLEDGTASRLTGGLALLGGHGPDVGFDGVERLDPYQGLGGYGRGAGGGELVERAADARPAEGELTSPLSAEGDSRHNRRPAARP